MSNIFLKQVDRRLVGSHVLPHSTVHVLSESWSHQAVDFVTLQNTSVCFVCLLLSQWLQVIVVILIIVGKVDVFYLQDGAYKTGHTRIINQVFVPVDPQVLEVNHPLRKVESKHSMPLNSLDFLQIQVYISVIVVMRILVRVVTSLGLFSLLY